EKGCGAPRLNASKKGQKLEDLTAVRFNMETAVIRTEENHCGCEDKNNCQCGGKTGLIGTNNQGVFDALRTRFKNLFKMDSFRENQELVLSDDDIRVAITAAMRKADLDFFWVIAVFQGNDNTGTFVYESWSDYQRYAQDFSIKDDGTVVLSGDRVQVRPETRFVPVKVETGEQGLSTQSSGESQEVTNVDKEKLVQSLIDNAATRFEESDRSWLLNLESTALEKLMPQDQESPTEGDPDGSDPNAAGNGDGVGEQPSPATLHAYIAAAPPEVQEVLQSGLRMHQTRKNTLIAALVANKRNKFSKQYLEQQNLETLENLATLADVKPDYSGRGAVRHQAENDNVIQAPPELFPVKSA